MNIYYFFHNGAWLLLKEGFHFILITVLEGRDGRERREGRGKGGIILTYECPL